MPPFSHPSVPCLATPSPVLPRFDPLGTHTHTLCVEETDFYYGMQNSISKSSDMHVLSPPCHSAAKVHVKIVSTQPQSNRKTPRVMVGENMHVSVLPLKPKKKFSVSANLTPTRAIVHHIHHYMESCVQHALWTGTKLLPVAPRGLRASSGGCVRLYFVKNP
jgi:hypothetical protein